MDFNVIVRRNSKINIKEIIFLKISKWRDKRRRLFVGGISIQSYFPYDNIFFLNVPWKQILLNGIL